MGLIHLKEIDSGTKLGVWDIEEDEDFLLSRLTLNSEEKSFLSSVRSHDRYLHWLGSRVLIKELLQDDQFVDMRVDEYGKPKLINFPYHVSISHSHDYAAVIMSRDYPVGIDVELIHPKIERVAHKFLRREELDVLHFEEEIEEMYVHWCAKEVLFKIYGKGKINFKENIPLEPFDYQETGRVHGSIIKDDFRKKYEIFYEKMDEYMLVWTVDKSSA